MKPKVDADRQGGVSSPDEPVITYPVLDENQLSLRWNLSPKTLQKWRSEGIGPPAWHLNRSVRYPQPSPHLRESKHRCERPLPEQHLAEALYQRAQTLRGHHRDQLVEHHPLTE